MNDPQTLTVKIIDLDHYAAKPPGKLAEAEIRFSGGPLDGAKLIGFAVWRGKTNGVPRRVTFPARQYSVNGERRSFNLLRPIIDSSVMDRIEAFILAAYASHEAEIETGAESYTASHTT